MNIILLSGGSGKRLWPLSNDIRSKQFLKIFKNEDGTYDSMLQKMYCSIRKIDSDARIVVATSKFQIPSIRNQIGDDVFISVEPCRRDTFPAIALASIYLSDVLHVSREESVIVCPVDPFVDDSYFDALRDLDQLALQKRANLVLMGIEPTYPSAKYGYIIPKTNEKVSDVLTFKEKPDEETAKAYIAQNALWNAGVFAYRLSYMIDKAHELINFSDYEDLFSKYDTLEKISYDYAVAEKEKSIAVMRFSGEWKDLGTWNTLTEAMEEYAIGDVRYSETCENVHAINDLGIPIVVMGVRNAVICASPDGILVSDKVQSSYIKPYVDAIDRQVMFAEKSWGNYRILDVKENCMTVKIILNPGHHMSYHSHDKRDEVWTVISGSGKTIVDRMEQQIREGDVVTMAAGCKHTVLAGENGLQLIEIQLGHEISVSDKHKYEFPVDL